MARSGPRRPKPLQRLTVAKISRRASFVAALLAAGQRTAAEAATATGDPLSDSPLIDLVRELLEAVAEEEQLVAPYYRMVRFTYPPEVEARLDALADRQALLRHQIAALLVDRRGRRTLVEG